MQAHWKNQQSSLSEITTWICPAFLMALIGSGLVTWQTQLSSTWQYILYVAVFSFSSSFMYFQINHQANFKRHWHKSITALLSLIIALCGVTFGLGVVQQDWELCRNTILSLLIAPFILMKIMKPREFNDF